MAPAGPAVRTAKPIQRHTHAVRQHQRLNELALIAILNRNSSKSAGLHGQTVDMPVDLFSSPEMPPEPRAQTT